MNDDLKGYLISAAAFLIAIAILIYIFLPRAK